MNVGPSFPAPRINTQLRLSVGSWSDFLMANILVEPSESADITEVGPSLARQHTSGQTRPSCELALITVHSARSSEYNSNFPVRCGHAGTQVGCYPQPGHAIICVYGPETNSHRSRPTLGTLQSDPADTTISSSSMSPPHQPGGLGEMQEADPCHGPGVPLML